MKKTLFVLTLVFCLALSTAAFAAVLGGPHDLSDSMALTSGTADQICVYCHHPHGTGSSMLLWNMNDVTTDTFSMYSSPFAQSTSSATIAPGADADGSGGTAECMSCHDGVIGTDALVSEGAGGLNTNYTLSAYAALGTDLTDDHPVGFNYATVQAADTELKATPTGNIVFYGSGEMACASCHDVHDTNNSPFLRGSLSQSALCLDCHIK